MKKLTYIIIILLAVILAMGCTNLFNPDDGSGDSDNTGDDGTGDDGTTTNTVYAAGFYEDSSQSVASYWVHVEDGSDPVGHDLYSQSSSEVRAIEVVNDVVYAAGYYTNDDGNDAACYWLDGQKTDLYSDVQNEARATGLFVNGSDVYVSGYIYDSSENEKRAVYWKNGNSGQVPLHQNVKSEASDIFVYQNDVYVSGYTNSGEMAACYWVNDGNSKNDLEYNEASEATSIYVDDSGTVYTSGRDFIPGIGYEACYWEGNTKSSLSSVNSWAYDIEVIGGNVYVAGYYKHNLNVRVACYWLNNSAGMVELFKDDNNSAEAYGAAIQDGDIYISGYIHNGTVDEAVYWKNAKTITLNEGINSHAFDVAVQVQ